MIISHPEGYKGNYGPSPCLQSTTLSDYSTDFTSFYCDSKVNVNTCTCTDVFTIITTKDQSGGIYNSYSTGGQGFMAVVNKPHNMFIEIQMVLNRNKSLSFTEHQTK